VFFEAPHRLRQTLEELTVLLGKQPILLGRELTKVHEEWQWAPSAELATALTKPQGEFVALIPPLGIIDAPARAPSDEEIRVIFGQLTNLKTLGRRAAIREVAIQAGLSPNAVYEALERCKNSGN
jgi:16S rRNA (cytidine1402-2'-O)-methyltransferase